VKIPNRPLYEAAQRTAQLQLIDVVALARGAIEEVGYGNHAQARATIRAAQVHLRAAAQALDTMRDCS
jgi:hypothetical protein